MLANRVLSTVKLNYSSLVQARKIKQYKLAGISINFCNSPNTLYDGTVLMVTE